MSIPVFDSAATATIQPGTSVTRAKGSAGANRLALVVTGSATSGVTATGVTCDGVVMVPVLDQIDPGSFQVKLWRNDLATMPPTASVNYIASFSGNGNQIILVATYNNVHQTTPLGTAVTNSATSQNPGTGNFTSATDELAIGVYQTVNATGRTIDGNDEADDGFFPHLALLFDKTGAATSSFLWPQTNSVVWGAIGVSLKGISAQATGISGHGTYAVRIPRKPWRF